MAGVEVDVSDPPFDRYTGSAEALIRAGIITAEQLPKPGSNQASFLPDGRRAYQGIAKNSRYSEGYRRVIRRPKERYLVEVTVSEEEQKRRWAEAPEVARPLHSNVIPFPLERSKARPVVMAGRVIPMAELVGLLRRAQYATDIHFEGLIVEVRQRLEGRNV